MKSVLVTGAAGFIGFHLVETLLKNGSRVVGIDNINGYYDVKLKFDRLNESGIIKENVKYNFPVQSVHHLNYIFHQLDITDLPSLEQLFIKERH